MNKRKQATLVALLSGMVFAAPVAGWGQEPLQEAGLESPVADPEAEEAEPGDGSEEEEAEDPATTGDAWVDAQLADIGRYARRYPDTFADELQRYHDAPRASVRALLEEGSGWAPGDVYFACALGSVTGRACRFVVDQRGDPPRISWRALAEELGAGPGTEAFARLKRGIVESYGRWGRPIELDAGLAEAFPDHPRPQRAGD